MYKDNAEGKCKMTKKLRLAGERPKTCTCFFFLVL